jgi:hypothetical protein
MFTANQLRGDSNPSLVVHTVCTTAIIPFSHRCYAPPGFAAGSGGEISWVRAFSVSPEIGSLYRRSIIKGMQRTHEGEVRLVAYCYCYPDLQDVTKRHFWPTSLKALPTKKLTWRGFWMSFSHSGMTMAVVFGHSSSASTTSELV